MAKHEPEHPSHESPIEQPKDQHSEDIINFDTLKEEIVETKQSSRPTAELSKETCTKVLHTIKEKKNLKNINQALILTTGLAQNGGTNRNAGSSISYSAFNKTLNVSDLQSYLRANNLNTATIRQFCRGLANEIAQTAEIIGQDGDLANQMGRDDPNITKAEAAWCSNFQTTNPNCPEKVRHWLLNNFKDRFKQ
jgi:hypothetical protein